MSTTTRWWWLRHAPVVNHGGRIYGHTDVEADTGDARAFAALAATLPARPLWLRTPLRRTAQTLAAVLAARPDTERVGAGYGPGSGAEPLVEPDLPLVEPDLMEQHFGVWQGMTYAEVEAARGAPAHRFWMGAADERPDGGESFTDVVARVAPAVERLSRRHAGRDIVAVAHGGTIRAALAVALGLDPEAALRFCVDNLSLTRIDHLVLDHGEVAWRIESVNRVPG
jgi:broad specificity phosphatase PhoE